MQWRFFTINYMYTVRVILSYTISSCLYKSYTQSRLTNEDCSLSLIRVDVPPTKAPPLILLPLPLILMCEAPPTTATPSIAGPPATPPAPPPLMPPMPISLRLNFFLAPRCLKEWASVWPELNGEEEEVVVGIIWGGGAPSLVALP
jgi:hypothetical protein